MYYDVRMSMNPQFRENRIYEVIQTSIQIFQRTGLDELARKWMKILQNYESSLKRQDLLTRSNQALPKMPKLF